MALAAQNPVAKEPAAGQTLPQTAAQSGEARRNENRVFDLVDNNALKEQNARLGTAATVVTEFKPASGYFSAEFGNAPVSVATLSVTQSPRRWNAALRATHQNSVFNARRFFQVGGVQPSRENEYGFDFTTPVARKLFLTLSGSQQKIRGNVNGNVLVPLPSERMPLTLDPAKRSIIERWVAAYPVAEPNRTDIDKRALNVNAPQSIDTDAASARLDSPLNARDRLALRHSWTSQHVKAFQFVAGQNPWTTIRSHGSRLNWTRTVSSNTVADFTLGFDRATSALVPEPNAVGPAVEIGTAFTKLGPGSNVPLDRIQNRFRYAASLSHKRRNHSLTLGGELTRLQFNGREASSNRSNWYFRNDFGRDAITNFLLGESTRFSIGIGGLDRGFRNFEQQYYAGGNWQAGGRLTVSYGVRYQPVTSPHEVNGLTPIPFGGDRNNVAPRFGIAKGLPRKWGVLRANYALDFAEFFAVTLQQLRWNAPNFLKLEINSANLLNPLAGAPLDPGARSTYYDLAPSLGTPYSHQYNFSWELEPRAQWRVQLGYVGSRSRKLFMMWHTNRAVPVPGIPFTTATINQRRPDQRYFEIRRIENGSKAWFDAARVSLLAPDFHGLLIDAAYWFSKALDTGSAYSNTAAGDDSRQGQSQSEYLVQQDLKAASDFDQRHALLLRARYALPRHGGRWRAMKNDWSIQTVYLAKTGLPFTVFAGSDAPGFGNADGSSTSDRPNLIDRAVLGRHISHPDIATALLPRSAFAFVTPGVLRGSLGRNTFRRGGISNINLSVSKVWPLASDRQLVFRLDSINGFNTPQFADPVNDMTNPAFGKITNTLNDGRVFALTLQLRL